MNCCDYDCNQGRDCPARKALMNNTRKYPRTMQEAFGPHTDDNLEPMSALDLQERIIGVGCVIVFVAFIIIAMLGLLP